MCFFIKKILITSWSSQRCPGGIFSCFILPSADNPEDPDPNTQLNFHPPLLPPHCGQPWSWNSSHFSPAPCFWAQPSKFAPMEISTCNISHCFDMQPPEDRHKHTYTHTHRQTSTIYKMLDLVHLEQKLIFCYIADTNNYFSIKKL